MPSQYPVLCSYSRGLRMCCISDLLFYFILFLLLTFNFLWNRCIRHKRTICQRNLTKTDPVSGWTVFWGRSSTLEHDWSDQPPINVKCYKGLFHWAALEESRRVIGRLVHRSWWWKCLNRKCRDTSTAFRINRTSAVVCERDAGKKK